MAQRRTLTSIALSSLSGTQKTYAELLAQEYGYCCFLHYGLLPKDHKKREYQEQQQAFSEKLYRLATNQLKTHSEVLLDGPSLSYLGSMLIKQGCKVAFSTNFLKYPPEHKFDLIVIEGAYHYLEQLPLLNKAREMLKDSARLLIFGEYLDDDSELERSTLPNLSSMRQLSERLSYSVLQELNFSHDALYSIGQLKNIVDKRINEIGEVTSTLLLSQFRHLEEEYVRKRRSFNIFLLQKNSDPKGEYALAEYGAIDSFEPGEISELFEKSFGTKFNRDIWRWKYGLGEGKCIVARELKDGAIVSHYGGVPREIQYFGEPNIAIQVCDVMVLPEIRRQYGRGSLFFKTAATFLEREIGNTVKHLLGFGFPNQKAMNIALRLGLYEKTDDFVELIFPKPEEPNTTTFHLLPIDIANPQHQREIDKLWRSMKLDMSNGIIGDHHWRYIKYRYFDHPFYQANLYRSIFVNDESGNMLAVVVLKEHEKRMLIMDLICPVARMKIIISQLVHLIEESELKFWVTQGWMESVRTDQAIENQLGIEIPCNFWNPGPSPKLLYGAWWLTAGDMDFM